MQTIISVPPDTDWAVKVRGLNHGLVYGEWSDEIIMSAIGDPTDPGQITGLAVTGLWRALKLAWANPPDQDIKYCRIFISSTAIPVDASGKVQGLSPVGNVDTDYCLVGGLEVGTTYYVRIEAVDLAGRIGPASDQVSAATIDSEAAITDIPADYTAGDLDSEDELIAAINGIGTAVNSILAALRAHGLIKI